MITSLRGKIIHLAPFQVRLEVQGVGYQVAIPLGAYQALKTGSDAEVFLHTRVIYRDDNQSIYGFLTPEEAELFSFLLNLSGIGARVALNLISTLGTTELLRALEASESEPLTRAPRVGKAKADKIIFEAKGKLKKITELLEGLNAPASASIKSNGDLDSQINDALNSLGFQKKEIDQAFQKLQKTGGELPPATEEHLQEWLRLYLTKL